MNPGSASGWPPAQIPSRSAAAKQAATATAARAVVPAEYACRAMFERRQDRVRRLWAYTPIEGAPCSAPCPRVPSRPMGDPSRLPEDPPRSDAGARSARARRRPRGDLRRPARPRGRRQGARCMDCGVPFCHDGCPLGNLIPDWNDLVYRGRWREAIDQLHATNNFPEFTGLICPAPCESACVLAINDDPVMIKQIEYAIVHRALGGGLDRPARARRAPGAASRSSAPARRAWPPRSSSTRRALGRRLRARRGPGRAAALRRARTPSSRSGSSTGASTCSRPRGSSSATASMSAARRRSRSSGRVRRGRDRHRLARPARHRRPGARARGREFAMDYLYQRNRWVARSEGRAGEAERVITGEGKHVVVIGGGDTGMDCVSSANREGAASSSCTTSTPSPPGRPLPGLTLARAPAPDGHHLRARRGRRAPVRDPDHACRLGRPRRRGRGPPGRGDVVRNLPRPGLGVHRAGRPRPGRDRLHAPEHEGSSRQLAVDLDARGNVKARRSPPPSTASSPAATRAAASRSSSPRSPRGGAARARWTGGFSRRRCSPHWLQGDGNRASTAATGKPSRRRTDAPFFCSAMAAPPRPLPAPLPAWPDAARHHHRGTALTLSPPAPSASSGSLSAIGGRRDEPQVPWAPMFRFKQTPRTATPGRLR